MNPMRLFTFSLAVSAACLIIAPSSHAYRAPEHGHGLEDLDRRDARGKDAPNKMAPEKAQTRANGEAKLKNAVPELQVDRHSIHGSPKWISTSDGFLTGPDGAGRGGNAEKVNAFPAADSHRVIKAFVNEHAAVFGHDATTLESARVMRDYVTEHNGVHTVIWQQEHEGLEVFESIFMAHVTKRGELVNVSSQFLPDTADAAKRGHGGKVGVTPQISAQRAVTLAAKHLGDDSGSEDLTALDDAAGAERKQRFRTPAVKGDARVRLVWLPMDSETMRLCWEVGLKSRSRSEVYRLLLDAETGEVLLRRNQTVYISNASYRVYTNDSPTPFSPAHPAPGATTQPAAASRALVVTSALNPTASPNGWITDGVNETRGNNIDASTDLDDDEVLDLPRPQGSPNRVFDFPMNLNNAPSTYSKAAVVSLFYWCNWIHDKLWELGFNEGAGNYQINNFGRGGVGNDAVRADAQDGGGFDNANFNYYSNHDGDESWIQMYLFSGPSPDHDGDFDSEVMIHEYVHGLSLRLVGGGVGISQPQSKGMGEGWGDFFAFSLLSQPSDNIGGTYPLGGYVCEGLSLGGTRVYDNAGDNYYFGIRRYPCSTNMAINPLTFKDLDGAQASTHPGVPLSPIFGGSSASEVHNQGEVWCVALWDCRANLIAKYGYATGNQLMLQLAVDAMKLCPPNPNFLQSRDAILQADFNMTGGTNKNELWAGFAKRGMGVNATSPASSTTAGVVEDFEVPDKMRITPLKGPTFSGPIGGPFNATNFTFVVSNTGPGNLLWRANAPAPLEVLTLSGTLAVNGKTNVVVTVNPTAAATLSPGTHQVPVSFSNQTSGVVLTRFFTFAVGSEGSPPSEEFTGGADSCDLDFTMLTFTPKPAGGYTVCREAIASLPTATIGSLVVPVLDDDFEEFALSGGKVFPFYGSSYTSVFIGGNGDITFDDGYSVPAPTLSKHFLHPRVSALFADLKKSTGRVWWQEFSDRAVATWDHVTDFPGTKTNTFQVELYFDGRIRIAYEQVQMLTAIVGVSPGLGQGGSFAETDFSSPALCSLKPVVLTLPEPLTEGNGSVSGARITVTNFSVVDRTFTLVSSDTSELTVPPSVIMPAGATTVVFSVTVANDAILDGSQIVYVTATGSGFAPATTAAFVRDNESATLSVSAIGSATEGGADGFGTVTVNTPVADTVGVTLTSANTNELVPVDPVVFIPQGQTSVVFAVHAVDDRRIDGAQATAIIASVSGWISGSNNVTTLDNESTNLVLKVPLFVSESSGTLTNAGTVQLGGTLATNLLVGVFSSDTTEIDTPLFGVFVPAGQTNALFTLFVKDDAIIDGLQLVSLNAAAGGFGGASSFIFVGDNDGPPEPYNPYPPHESINIPLNADLSWGRTEGEILFNGDFETGNLTGWTQEDVGAGGFVANNGTYDPASSDAASAPFAGSFSALSDQLGNGSHAIYQDVLIPIGATSVVLSWRDRIHNHALQFSSSQQFRVELRNPTNNAPLTTLFFTTNNSPLFTEWTNRSVNLMGWRGQYVRVAFVEVDGLGYMNVGLDNISLLAPSATPTTFDVYLGTNNPPTAADYLGATTNTFWTLPLLAGGTDYYWQLKARRGAVTNVGDIWHFTTESSSTNTALITFNSSWRYRNNGQNLGTAWTNLNYNDSVWSTGLGVLGFGGAEDTTITGQANGYITYYFRRKFTLTDASKVTSLVGRLIRDDGAIVWINGRAAISSNTPRPPVAYDDEAVTETTGFGEILPFTFELSPGLLVDGTNVVAVEVHQWHPALGFSPDLYFDFELRGLLNNGNEAPTIQLTAPSPFAQITGPTNVLLQAIVGDDALVLFDTVEFFVDGAKIGQDSLAGYSFTWTNALPGPHILTAIVTDGGGLKATSAPVHVVIKATTGSVLSLISPGANWSFLDTGLTPAANWKNPGYSARWSSGPAQLGYGDGDEATLIDYGPDPLDKYITTYFRRSFSTPATLSSLRLRVLRDDGVAVYLNGTEILRDNLPGGALTGSTLASATVAGAAENIWVTSNLPPSALTLLQANNIIAAEVHQSAANTPDMSFDLELLGVGNLPPTVSLTAPANNSVVGAGADIPLSALTSDPYGAVTQVQFRRNGVLFATDASAPFATIFNSASPGPNTFTAVATDSGGLSVTSAPVTVLVLAPAVLAIREAGAQMQITWSTNAPGYVLESTTNLNPPVAWGTVTNAAVPTNSLFQVLINPAIPQRFFRLRAP